MNRQPCLLAELIAVDVITYVCTGFSLSTQFRQQDQVSVYSHFFGVAIQVEVLINLTGNGILFVHIYLAH